MRFLRKLHKWLGLIVGLQVLLWAVSGLVFAWLNHHDVSGEHSVRDPQAQVLAASASFVEPASWLGELDSKEILEIRLFSVLDRWVWRVETAQGVMLRDAVSGEVTNLSEAEIRDLAQEQYAGKGRLASVTFHPNETIETRDSGATWQARFDDERGTTLYFSADDGRLVQTRGDSWRLFDFFWMLHTMDYRGRDNFNNPLVITIGFAALWLSLSGLLLLFKSFRRQDFAFITRRG
ncbi:PepSY domain-containing protein [Peristeroidobacter agariperforans]|uniref:PepSY domain-containing protein n=1 Tax=Peristeroidobacter agariperforans TaxID=268404 RepID=UPI00101D5EEA|nr:PepSY domain-containing protein [Peristeroidobacter agariperforans]